MKASLSLLLAALLLIIVGVAVALVVLFPAPDQPNGRVPPTPPSSGPPPNGTTPPSPPGSSPPPLQDLPYSFEDLKTGSLGGKIIHCSGPLFTPSHHDAYLAAFPTTKPFMVRTDVNIGETRFTIDQMITTLGNAYGKHPNEVPLLSILYTKSSPSGVTGLDAEVAAGEYDSHLKKLAAFVKGFDTPVFVRLAQEFNGNWNNYHQESFAPAFRHIVDVFEAEGVGNAIYMWNYMPLSTPFNYSAWYPGDDVVDYWSVDVFDNHFSKPAANAELKRFLNDAVAHGKPIIIPEAGPATLDVNDVATWDAWFVPFFALVNDPAYGITGFCYSNEDFTKTTTEPTWKNVQLQGTPIAPLYQEELLKPQYLHQQE